MLSVFILFSIFSSIEPKSSLAGDEEIEKYVSIALHKNYKVPEAKDIQLVKAVVALTHSDQKFFIYSKPNTDKGTSSREYGTNVMTIGFDGDRNSNLFAIFHELGHLAHGDVDPVQSCSVFSPHPDPSFLTDLAIIKRYREMGTQVIDPSSRVGNNIHYALNNHISFSFSSPHFYLQAARSHDQERRADLYALRKLDENHLLGPILKALEQFSGTSDYQTSKTHPNDYERALYIVGFLHESLQNKGLDVNQIIKDFESNSLIPIESEIHESFGTGSEGGVFPKVSDLAKINELILMRSKSKQPSENAPSVQQAYAPKSELEKLESLDFRLMCLIPGECTSNSPFHLSFRTAVSELRSWPFINRIALPEEVPQSAEAMDMTWLHSIRMEILRQIWKRRWEMQKVTHPELQIITVFIDKVWNTFLSNPKYKRFAQATGLLEYNFLVELIVNHSNRATDLPVKRILQFDRSQEEWILTIMGPLLGNNKDDPPVDEWINERVLEIEDFWDRREGLMLSEEEYFIHIYNLVHSVFRQNLDGHELIRNVSEIDSSFIENIGFQQLKKKKIEDWTHRKISSQEAIISELNYSVQVLSRVEQTDFRRFTNYHKLLIHELSTAK